VEPGFNVLTKIIAEVACRILAAGDGGSAEFLTLKGSKPKTVTM
jgi:hypothetical protein